MAFMASVSHTWFGNHRARDETPAYTFANSEIFSRKIHTPEQLHSRYVEPLIEKRSWYDEEGLVDVHWMRTLFEKFAEGPEDDRYWTKASVANYLEAVLPPDVPEVRSLWTPCVPALYRLLLALGQYPFHVHLIFSKITFNIFYSAITCINLRYDNVHEYHSVSAKVRWARFRRLLFQSLMLGNEPYCKTCDEGRERGGKDDEDLQVVLPFIGKGFYYRDENNPKIRHVRPGMPVVGDFPSSCSTNVSGIIPRQELRDLVKLLLALMLSREGVGLQLFVKHAEVLDAVVQSGLTAFSDQISDENESNATFEKFDSALKHHIPNILFGLDRIFRPAIRPSVILSNRDPFDTADLPIAISILQVMSMNGPQQKHLPEGCGLLTTPLLLQLATFLPETLRISRPSVTALRGRISPAYIHETLQKLRTSSIALLVFGSTTIEGKEYPFTFGVFFESSSVDDGYYHYPSHPMIFQLQPTHKVFQKSEMYPAGMMYTPPSSASKEPKLVLAMHPSDEKVDQARIVFRHDGAIDYCIDGVGGHEKRSLEDWPGSNGRWTIDRPVVELVQFKDHEAFSAKTLHEPDFVEEQGSEYDPWHEY